MNSISTRGARQDGPWTRRLLPWLLVLLPGLALAQMDLSPLTVNRALTWTGADVSEQVSFCVESFAEAPDKKSSNPIPYAVSASIGGATTPFSLANGAGQTVPVTLSWTDTIAGATFALAPAAATSNTLTGRLAACPGGNNGLLTLAVAATDLGAAAPGTYSRTFAVEATNLGSGRSRRSANVTLSITIPTVIRISDINDLVLGTFDGVNDLVASDTVCIYKNGGLLYGITATGSGVAGAFTLSNGASTAPYSVTWQDNLGTLALVPGVQVNARGNAVTTSTTCNGGAGNNATFTVRITAASLLTAVQPGLYSGVLTLMVVPQ